MDLREDLLRELQGAADADDLMGRLARFASGRARCPRVAAYRLEGTSYRPVSGGGPLPALPPTTRTSRNVLLPGEEPGRPPAFLRLEWDAPRIHDIEAVEALEEACAAAAELLAKLA